jgi:hypothetical protein
MGYLLGSHPFENCSNPEGRAQPETALAKWGVDRVVIFGNLRLGRKKTSKTPKPTAWAKRSGSNVTY